MEKPEPFEGYQLYYLLYKYEGRYHLALPSGFYFKKREEAEDFISLHPQEEQELYKVSCTIHGGFPSVIDWEKSKRKGFIHTFELE